MRAISWGTLSLLAFAAFASPAPAYIEAVYTLEQIMQESEVIAEGVIERIHAGNKIGIVKIRKSLKGECAYAQVRMNLGVGQYWHPDAIMRHLVVGAPALVFYNAERLGMLYVNRFFIQLYGDKAAAPQNAWWNFTHIEIRCNRTFNGPVAELHKLVTEILAGKGMPPSPDLRIPPITQDDMKALPHPGIAAGEAQMPPAFRKGGPFKPRRAETPSKTAPGAKFEYYEGDWNDYPEFAKVRPLKRGVAEKLDLSKRLREKGVAFRFSGFIEVPKDATYTFSLSGPGGYLLFFGNAQVVKKVGFQGTLIEISGAIDLKAGKHAFTLVFYDAGVGDNLNVFWAAPELPRELVPGLALSHVP